MQVLFIHMPSYPPVIRLVIHLVIWCFPIWLTSSLSYPMAIFSAHPSPWSGPVADGFSKHIDHKCQNENENDIFESATAIINIEM